MKPAFLALAIVLLLVFLTNAFVFDDVQAQTTSQRLEADAQYSMGGTEQCLTCHGGESMTAMAQTPHGNLDNPHSPFAQKGCESCHGPGSIHVSRAGGGVGFPKLINFKSYKDVPEQNTACMTCHADTMGELHSMGWFGSVHETANLSCQDCHQAHSVEQSMVTRDQQLQRCGTCHKRQVSVHPEFDDKGIKFDEVKCTTCHSVHELKPNY